MRATSTRRLLGGAAALMLVGASLLSSTAAFAATTSTRLIYVGSDPNFTANNYTITFSPVSTGGLSVSPVYVKNTDNQSLTHVVLTFSQSQGGVSISDTVLGADAASCPASNGVITCDFGTLKARATRSFQLLLTAPATAATYPIAGTVVFNESNNPNGGNLQINDITGSFVVSETTCDAAATFLPPGISQNLLPDDGTCSTDPQRSSILVPANANGSVASIDDGAAVTDCPAGYSCFGNQVAADVNGGATVSPYLTWYITYSAGTMQNINPKQVGFQHGITIILPGKKGTCGTNFTQDCIVGYTVDSAGNVTFEIRTGTNSLMKGLH